MDAAGITLLVVNMIAGLFGARKLARLLGRARPGAVRASFVVFLGVYLVESLAVAASMMTMILPIALALVWPRLLGRWLMKSWAPVEHMHEMAHRFAVYTGIPALSLVLVPLVAALHGRGIVGSVGGASMGIPEFMPWPLNSVLGFFGVISVAAFILKVIITTKGMHRRVAARPVSHIDIAH